MSFHFYVLVLINVELKQQILELLYLDIKGQPQISGPPISSSKLLDVIGPPISGPPISRYNLAEKL